jgi:hypothetical protein
VILLWPAVSVLGFVGLVGVVVALGTSSTARYVGERNRVQAQPRTAPAEAVVPVVTAAAPSAADRAPLVTAPATRDQDVADQAAGRARQEVPSTVATLPPAPAAGGGSTPTWWVVAEEDHRVVSGPFADRVEAEWASLSGAVDVPAHALHGVRRPDGRVVRRQTPEDLAWLTDLGDQLDRLPLDWDDQLSDDDPTVTLVVEVAAALVESGLPLHDCAGEDPAGGLCLTPEPGCGGVLVSWHQHDRMSRDLIRGTDAVTAVQRTLNAAVAECLEALGFLVAPVGSSGCSLVIDARSDG